MKNTIILSFVLILFQACSPTLSQLKSFDSVVSLKENGLIKILPIGNIFSKSLIGQRVRILNSKEKEIVGVIVSKSQLALSNDEKKMDIKYLYLHIIITHMIILGNLEQMVSI